MRKNWRRFWVQHIPWISKILFCFWIEAYLFFVVFFWNGYIRNVVSTLPNVKIDVENKNVVSTLSNVFQFNAEIHNVVSTLLNVVGFNVDVHNVDLTLCDVATSSYQPKSNVEPTLKCLLGNTKRGKTSNTSFREELLSLQRSQIKAQEEQEKRTNSLIASMLES